MEGKGGGRPPLFQNQNQILCNRRALKRHQITQMGLNVEVNLFTSQGWRMKGMESGKKYIKLNKSRKNPGTIEKTTKEGLFVSAP